METNKDIEQLLLSIQKAFDVLVEKSTDLPISTIRDDTRSPASLRWRRCADKLEEYTAVLGNRASLDSVAGTYCGVLPPNVETTLTLNAIKNSRQEKFYESLIAFFIERLQHIIYNTSQGKRFYEKLYQKKVCYNSPNYG